MLHTLANEVSRFKGRTSIQQILQLPSLPHAVLCQHAEVIWRQKSKGNPQKTVATIIGLSLPVHHRGSIFLLDWPHLQACPDFKFFQFSLMHPMKSRANLCCGRLACLAYIKRSAAYLRGDELRRPNASVGYRQQSAPASSGTSQLSKTEPVPWHSSEQAL
eukprot:6187659-Pleurochrysis_carterae.AAC.4